MSQLAPSPAHKRFAGQIAWERGQKIVNWPATSSALSGLIQNLRTNCEPLAAVEWQVERYRRLVSDCAAKVEGFDPAAYAEVPADRAEANKAIFQLEKTLNRTDFRAASSGSIEEYVVVADDAAPSEATREANVTAQVADSSVEPTDDIPF